MRLQYAPYRRNFSTPFPYGHRILCERYGILIRLGSSVSEASPLPGHSRESLEEVLHALESRSGWSDAIEGEEREDLPASLRFALEGIRALREKGPRYPVSSNALLSWKGTDETGAQLEEKIRSGYSCFKLKILEENAGEILGFLQGLERADLMFRLDGNGALSEETVKKIFHSLDGFSALDYLEEPCKDWSLPLLGSAPFPLAADESAGDPARWEAFLTGVCVPDVLIVKPTVAGGLFSLEPKLSPWRERGKRIVYTSSLEAEAGRRSLLAYLSLRPGREIHGLSTGFLLEPSFLPDLSTYDEIPALYSDEEDWMNELSWKEVRS